MFTAKSSEQKSETPQAAVEAEASRPSVWVASELDAAAASPVHAMQASLAGQLDQLPARRRFDPTWLFVMAFNATCWWGLVMLAVAMLHGWNR
jgi:hypothetical protein